MDLKGGQNKFVNHENVCRKLGGGGGNATMDPRSRKAPHGIANSPYFNEDIAFSTLKAASLTCGQ